MRELWVRIKEKLSENPEMMVKAAHTFILFGVFMLVRSLLRVINNIDVKRELSQRRMKVETWNNHHQRMDLDEDHHHSATSGTYRIFNRKFREIDSCGGDMQGLAVVSYNHDDDTFDIVKPLNSRSDDDGDVRQHTEDVAMVERILGERKDVKESNALRFLSDLH